MHVRQLCSQQLEYIFIECCTKSWGEQCCPPPFKVTLIITDANKVLFCEIITSRSVLKKINIS